MLGLYLFCCYLQQPVPHASVCWGPEVASWVVAFELGLDLAELRDERGFQLWYDLCLV